MDTPINLPSHIVIGAPVRVAEWIGLVEDIAIGQSHTMILIASPKQVYRHAPAEWLEFFTENPGLIKSASRLEYAKECKRFAALMEQEKARLAGMIFPEPVEAVRENKSARAMTEIKKAVLKILESHARNVFNDNFVSWRNFERLLEAEEVACEIEPKEDDPNVIRFSGLGIKAATLQARYSRSFENSLLGQYNHPVSLSFMQ